MSERQEGNGETRQERNGEIQPTCNATRNKQRKDKRRIGQVKRGKNKNVMRGGVLREWRCRGGMKR
jgi:hypothetical protein